MPKAPKSFEEIIQLAFTLLGLIPYLLAIYIFQLGKLSLTQTVMFMAIFALLSHLLGYSMMRRINDSLKDLNQKVHIVHQNNEHQPIQLTPNAPKEFHAVAHEFNRIVAELINKNNIATANTSKLLAYASQLDQYQKQREQLGRYVDPNIAQMLIQSDGNPLPQMQKRTATILFADIRSFSSLAEQHSPENIIQMLNRYFDLMVEIIFKHDGLLDKFIGDEMMVTFGLIDPVQKDPNKSSFELRKEATHKAFLAAIEIQQAAVQLRQEYQQRGWPAFHIGIGINTGPVVVGDLGSKNRKDYTVIGDSVNVASRLQNQAEADQILIGEVDAMEAQEHHIPLTSAGRRRVKNRNKVVVCYSIDWQNAGRSHL